jgi:hypothetical protein
VQDQLQALLARLRRQGFDEAARHLELAGAAFQRSEWESSNSQVRAGLEALFNSVAALRLKTSKTGGAAREALEKAGVLRIREARLVQEFMAVAGGAGAHAGVSNGDESLGRLLTGMGIAYIALALAPELVRVEDVLVGQLKAPDGARLPTDRELYTSCPTCQTCQTLSQAHIACLSRDTAYTCMNGCQVIVIIGEPDGAPQEGRGYRLGPHVIRNASDLFLPIGNGVVTIPASRAALMRSVKTP